MGLSPACSRTRPGCAPGWHKERAQSQEYRHTGTGHAGEPRCGSRRFCFMLHCQPPSTFPQMSLEGRCIGSKIPHLAPAALGGAPAASVSPPHLGPHLELAEPAELVGCYLGHISCEMPPRSHHSSVPSPCTPEFTAALQGLSALGGSCREERPGDTSFCPVAATLPAAESPWEHSQPEPGRRWGRKGVVV